MKTMTIILNNTFLYTSITLIIYCTIMGLSDFLKGLFNEENKNRTYFAILFSVINLILLIVSTHLEFNL